MCPVRNVTYVSGRSQGFLQFPPPRPFPENTAGKHLGSSRPRSATSQSLAAHPRPETQAQSRHDAGRELPHHWDVVDLEMSGLGPIQRPAGGPPGSPGSAIQNDRAGGLVLSTPCRGAAAETSLGDRSGCAVRGVACQTRSAGGAWFSVLALPIASQPRKAEMLDMETPRFTGLSALRTI
jgi:hypothetical protein